MTVDEFQTAVLDALGNLGACIQFALILVGCLVAVLAVKALW